MGVEDKENDLNDFRSSGDCHLRVECELKREIGIPCEHTFLIKPSTKMKLAITQCTNCFSGRNVVVDLLALTFGCAAWMGVNSVYLQLPLFVGPAPEQWKLPSYLVVIIQIANLGPIIYSIIQKCLPGRFKDYQFIYGILVIGCVASILMAFLYDKTSVVFGSPHSTAMLTIAFFLALVGCSSSVLCMPYMGRFRDIYMISYLMGEGVGGFLPSIVALIQGTGGNPECIKSNSTEGGYEEHYPPPLFGTTAFYIFIFVMYILSTIAFFLLNTLKVCKKEHVKKVQTSGETVSPRTQLDPNKAGTADEENTANANERPAAEAALELSKFDFHLLMALMGILSFMANGIFPSVQSYSCLPYGNRAYHLTVTLSTMANPLACFLAVFLPHNSVRHIVMYCFAIALLSCYALVTSLLSPAPPLQGWVIGEILVVSCWTLLVGVVSYTKLCIISTFGLVGGKSLFYVGSIKQFGSALGAVAIFLILSFSTIFKQYKHCA